MQQFRFLLGLAAMLIAAACAKKADPAPNALAGHAHKAPHGGTLVELGEHAYMLELVRNDAAGKLTAYVLDGHAEKPVRIKAPAIELVAMPGGKFTRVSLQAVANPATGEIAGDASQFAATADWLKEADEFAGLVTVEIRGTLFKQVEYELPK